jgi:hypothetical protein
MAFPSEELGEFLTKLKQRSGRSYEWIGRKTNMSRSTVQRYCTIQSIPDKFEPLERIAQACGADNDNITQLFQLWKDAVAASRDNANHVQPPTVDSGEPSTLRTGSQLSNTLLPASDNDDIPSMPTPRIVGRFRRRVIPVTVLILLAGTGTVLATTLIPSHALLPKVMTSTSPTGGQAPSPSPPDPNSLNSPFQAPEGDQIATGQVDPGRLQNTATSRCLDSDPSDNIFPQLDCNGANYQFWTYVTATHEIKNYQTKQCLDNATNRLAETEPGKVYTKPCHGGISQRWKVAHKSMWGYEIKNEATGRCLDSNFDGAVYTLGCNGGNFQRWVMFDFRPPTLR